MQTFMSRMSIMDVMPNHDLDSEETKPSLWIEQQLKDHENVSEYEKDVFNIVKRYDSCSNAAIAFFVNEHEMNEHPIRKNGKIIHWQPVHITLLLEKMQAIGLYNTSKRNCQYAVPVESEDYEELLAQVADKLVTMIRKDMLQHEIIASLNKQGIKCISIRQKKTYAKEWTPGYLKPLMEDQKILRRAFPNGNIPKRFTRHRVSKL